MTFPGAAAGAISGCGAMKAGEGIMAGAAQVKAGWGTGAGAAAGAGAASSGQGGAGSGMVTFCGGALTWISPPPRNSTAGGAGLHGGAHSGAAWHVSAWGPSQTTGPSG